jgi:hypothetical protein
LIWDAHISRYLPKVEGAKDRWQVRDCLPVDYAMFQEVAHLVDYEVAQLVDCEVTQFADCDLSMEEQRDLIIVGIHAMVAEQNCVVRYPSVNHYKYNREPVRERHFAVGD